MVEKEREVLIKDGLVRIENIGAQKNLTIIIRDDGLITIYNPNKQPEDPLIYISLRTHIDANEEA